MPFGKTTVNVTGVNTISNINITCSFDYKRLENIKPANYGTANATDNITRFPNISYSKVPGSTFPFGLTKVTATATDDDGN